MTGKDYSKESPEEVIKELNTSKDSGLSDSEAKSRLERYGYNEIPEKKVNPVLKFLSYFWGPIPWMIEIAALLSFLIQHWVDFWIIFSLLMVNGIIGFWQEHKAENIIAFLKDKLSLTARVLRDGKWKTIPARELVPGDIVRIRMGDIAPADIKLIEGEYVNVDESVLTGESVPVNKRVGEIVYSGAHVKRGEMRGVVVATGLNTYFGKTVQLVQIAKTESKYQKLVTKIGNFLILLTIFLVAAVAIIQLYRGMDPIELLRFSLVLVVAAIPAALPAVLSITMAIGAYQLAKKQAIVTKLVAIEELAGVDMLCADKTGTLTLNKLTVGEIIPWEGHSKENVILYAALASVRENKDPIDLAVLDEMEKMNLSSIYQQYKMVKFTPFDPIIKRTEAEVESTNGKLLVTKGAPQVILKLVDANDNMRAKISDLVNDNARHGYRIIGVAVKKNENWELAGLIPLFDPPREDAAETIKFLKDHGIRVKMITGDHLSIAHEVASHLHIGKDIYPYQVLKSAHPAKRAEFIERADGFAEVFPEHKFTIVDTLQKNGHTVAMTGDGVNDAPALKKADVGIAVAGATDAARSAAGIALLEEGISVIKDAVVTSRQIFKRMYSYVIYRITETIRVLFFITLAILAYNFYPITAVLIILLALLNDIPILTIAYDRVKIDRKPEKWNMHNILTLSSTLGILGVIETFLLLWISVRYLGISPTKDAALLQTIIFLKLAVSGHLTIFVTRTKGPFWSIMPGRGLLWSAVATKILATFIAVFGVGLAAAMPLWLAGFIWLYCLFWFVIEDITKMGVYNMLEGKHVFKKGFF